MNRAWVVFAVGVVGAAVAAVTVVWASSGTRTGPETERVTSSVDAGLRAPAEPPATSGLLGPATRFSHFEVGDANVKAILADGGTMWVGTSKGLVRYDVSNDRSKFYDHRNGLLADGVFSVDRIGDRIAVGTHGGGLALVDLTAEVWTIYNVPEGLGDAFVYDVLATRAGDVWIATWTGLNRVRGGALDDPTAWETFTVHSTGGGLPNDWVYGLAEGADGAVWVATEGGVARHHLGAWTSWNHDDGVGAKFEQVGGVAGAADPSTVSKHHARQRSEQGLTHLGAAFNPNYIVAITVDHSGTPWFGTWGGGLARWTGETWRNYTTAEGLPSNHVFMLHEDPEHRLWVGTAEGLARLEGDTFRAWTTEDGLFGPSVFSAATAEDGSLWVGSIGGVARFHPLAGGAP